MSSTKWRNARTGRGEGFRTIFRDGVVLLVLAPAGVVPGASAVVYSKANDNGRWMDEQLDSSWTRRTLAELSVAEEREDIERTVAGCYCDKGVGTCDFCGGVRVP